MTYEDPVEQDMVIPSPYDSNDEEWFNPFATIVEEEATLVVTDGFHMQMVYYDEQLEAHISGDTSMMSPSYSSCSREACCIEDYFKEIQHMMSLGYHFQLCSSRSIEVEVVQPTLPYIGKPLMIHLNKTKEGRWTGMVFIPRFHNICCLSFHLKHEVIYYIVNNFKILWIIGVTNMIVER